MTQSVNRIPWADADGDIACNLAMGLMVQALPQRLAIDGRLHAETYVSAAGVIAGYAAQRTLFGEMTPVPGENIHLMTTRDGGKYWFGDALNNLLLHRDNEDAPRRVWAMAAAGAMQAGLTEADLPVVGTLFSYVASSIGGANEGRSSVPEKHQAHLPARDLLKAVWPFALKCFNDPLPGAPPQIGKAPVAWWAAIAAQAALKPIVDVQSVLEPRIALTLLMESAIYASKLDATLIGGELASAVA
ncbi:hypothetical protein KPL74_05650 [Bacillus sp. NP157]|nr:hypothetical protein KPL74_05650 [Bacillus sp. NP157]